MIALNILLAVMAALAFAWWRASKALDQQRAQNAALRQMVGDLRCGLGGAEDGWRDAGEQAEEYEDALERIAEATRIEDAREIARDALGLPYSDWPLIERKAA